MFRPRRREIGNRHPRRHGAATDRRSGKIASADHGL